MGDDASQAQQAEDQSTGGADGTAPRAGNQPDPTPAPDANANADKDSGTASTASATGPAVSPPPVPPGPAPSGTSNQTFTAVRRAFALGWGIVELKGRIAAEHTEAEQRGMRVASLWRVSLSKIALMHSQVFPLIGTDNTFYAPRNSFPEYLFPDRKKAEDEAGAGAGTDVGTEDGTEAGTNAESIKDYTQYSLLDSRSDQDIKLSSFKLYDVTRRAINCLALLYVNPEESLDSGRIEELQNALKKAVDEEAKGQPPRRVLTDLVGKFLDAWDGFLREHYFAGGMLPNDEIESIAYEAGRSMASLSWKITNETLDWERSLTHLDGYKPASANSGLPELRKKAARDAADNDKVGRVWAHTFRQDFIIRLQHDIVALSSRLDQAYLAEKAATTAQQGTSPTQISTHDPELPSASIRAIKQGLEFWRRGVVKMLATVPKRDGPQGNGDSETEDEICARYADDYSWSPAMRLALTKQVNLWQTLMSGQQSLRAFTTESVAQKLVNEVWAEIQAGLSTDVTQTFKQTEKAAMSIVQEAGEAVTSVFDRARSYLWILGIFAVVVVLVAVFIIFMPNPVANGAAPSLGLAGIGAAAAALWKSRDLSVFQQKTSQNLENKKTDTAVGASAADAAQTAARGIGARLADLTHNITTDALSALKSGFGQVQLELDDLNRSVSVAYPLVDYIALVKQESGVGKGAGSVNFLRDIVWTSEERADELKAVIRAAFGPVALLAYSAVKPDKSDTHEGKGSGTEPEQKEADTADMQKQSSKEAWHARFVHKIVAR